MRNLKLLPKQRGIGLLELMLSLAIIAILLVMATRYFGITSRSQKVNQAINQLVAVKTGVLGYKGANSVFPNPGNLTMQVLYNQGYIAKSDWDAANNYVISPWGTPVTISSATETQVNVEANDIPSYACDNIQQKMGSDIISCSAGSGSDTSDLIYVITASGED